MFSKLFYQYKAFLKNDTVSTRFKGSVISLKPFSRLKLQELFDIDIKIGLSNHISSDSPVYDFLCFVNNIKIKPGVLNDILDFRLQFPDIDISDLCVWLIFSRFNKGKLKVLFKTCPDILLEVFPDIKDYLYNNYHED